MGRVLLSGLAIFIFLSFLALISSHTAKEYQEKKLEELLEMVITNEVVHAHDKKTEESGNDVASESLDDSLPPSIVCKLPKASGPCRAYMPRYYFDEEKGGCFQFIYGGCDGNANNFMTKENCEKFCT